MKLRNLLYLLLALPLFCAGCNNDPLDEPTDEPTNTYYMEKELKNCYRIGPVMGLNYQFMLMFESTDGSIALAATLYVDKSETVLKSGTYTSADGTFPVDGPTIMIRETNEIIYFDKDATGTAVVEVDGDNYKMDFLITDATQKSYHFTYDGTINVSE